MSTGRKTRAPEEQYRNQSTSPIAVSRYDLVLTVIPAAFLLAAVASGVLGVSLPTALAVGSLLGLAVLADALFLHPPMGGGPTS